MITVRLFGMTKMMAGNQPALSLNVADGRQVKDVIGAIEAGYPHIGELIQKKKVLVSVNQDIAHEDTIVHASDEIALLPPFAGGAPQGVETDRQRRSRIAQGLDVLNSVRLAPSLAAALLVDQFEGPVSRKGNHA
jgi:molybdopterin converting factor small subunit